jgi:hypothetical protein
MLGALGEESLACNLSFFEAILESVLTIFSGRCFNLLIQMKLSKNLFNENFSKKDLSLAV